LGLAIVRSLVQLHGGRVQAWSEGPGLGSVFTVRLPAPEDSTTPEVESHAKAPMTQRSRILIVDDNLDAAELLAEALASSGYKIALAHDGLSALTLAETFQPDAVLLDIGLPVMDGYEVARRIRTLPTICHARLIAITGYGQRTDVLRAKEAGFDQHLVKPVDLEGLLEVLEGAPRSATTP
jgi:CheY-like chemotaxis protein